MTTPRGFGPIASMFLPEQHQHEHGPDPEVVKAAQDFHKAEADQQIGWRKIQTGPWSFLFCTCRSPFDYRPGEPISESCIVHGAFVITYTGEVA